MRVTATLPLCGAPRHEDRTRAAASAHLICQDKKLNLLAQRLGHLVVRGKDTRRDRRHLFLVLVTGVRNNSAFGRRDPVGQPWVSNALHVHSRTWCTQRRPCSPAPTPLEKVLA